MKYFFKDISVKINCFEALSKVKYTSSKEEAPRSLFSKKQKLYKKDKAFYMLLNDSVLISKLLDEEEPLPLLLKICYDMLLLTFVVLEMYESD